MPQALSLAVRKAAAQAQVLVAVQRPVLEAPAGARDAKGGNAGAGPVVQAQAVQAQAVQAQAVRVQGSAVLRLQAPLVLKAANETQLLLVAVRRRMPVVRETKRSRHSPFTERTNLSWLMSNAKPRVRCRACQLAIRTTGLGRRRVFRDPIIVPKICRSWWAAR